MKLAYLVAMLLPTVLARDEVKVSSMPAENRDLVPRILESCEPAFYAAVYTVLAYGSAYGLCSIMGANHCHRRSSGIAAITAATTTFMIRNPTFFN